MQTQALNTWSQVGPAWSPTGNTLAFQAHHADGSHKSIYIIGADGRGKRRLAAGQNPIWSPDGKRLAIIYDYRLVTIDRSGKNRRRLSRSGEFVVAAAWSPKGGTIAYLAGTQPNPRKLLLATANTDGKHVRVPLHRPAGSTIWGAPVWTPNGKRILVATEPY